MHAPSHFASGVAQRDAPRILTRDRIRWRVIEILDTTEPHLLLCSRNALRVISPYPPNWRFMPDTDLYALSAGLDFAWAEGQ